MPAQTRGFLFSDIRGYTAFAERHGDRAARDLLSRYRSGVREVIGRFGGAEIRTEGDSFYVVFTSVSDAVLAGLAIVAAFEPSADRDPQDEVVAGVGIHAGEAEDSDEGIVSTAVNIAARICAEAGPREVLVSETVRSLTRTYLDVAFTSRGRRRLKGIAEPVPLYRVSTGSGSLRGRPRVVRRAAWSAAAAVGLAAAVFGIAVLGGTLLRTGAAGEQSPAGDSSLVPSVPATQSLSSPTSLPTGQFPNADEQDLLARLPTALGSETCFRADPDEIPRKYPFHGGQLEPLPVSAAVRCPLRAGIEVFFYAAAACNLVSACGADTEATIFSVAARREVPQATCEPGAEALDRWQFGRAEGWVLCGEDTLWTYDRTNLLGRVRGPDAATAFQWWHDNARFPAE